MPFSILPRVQKKLIIFDLDGTLFDTLPDLAPAVNAALAKFGLEPLSEECIRSYIGNGSRNLVMRSLGDSDVPLDEAHKEFLEFYRGHCTLRTTLMPGVSEFLKRDFRAAMFTNKPDAPTKLILAHFGLLGRFEQVLCGDTAPERKPSPAGIFKILEATEVDKADALMVGDDVPDLLAARAAGIDSVMILGGFGRPENLLPLAPERTVGRFADLLALAL